MRERKENVQLIFRKTIVVLYNPIETILLRNDTDKETRNTRGGSSGRVLRRHDMKLLSYNFYKGSRIGFSERNSKSLYLRAKGKGTS